MTGEFRSARSTSEGQSAAMTYGHRSDNSQSVDQHDSHAARVIWSPPDVMRLLTALGQHIKWLFIAPILALIATVGYLLMSDPSYDISAQVMVRFGNELAAPPTVATTQNQQVIPLSKRIEDVTAEVQIMKDPSIVHQLVNELGEDFFYGEPPAVTLIQKAKKLIKTIVNKTKEGIRYVLVKIGLLPELSKLDRVIMLIQSTLSIEPVTRSDVIELTMGYPDPGLGSALLEKFLEIYMTKRTEIYRDARVTVFFERELESIDKKLSDKEAEYQDLRQQNRVWSIDDQHRLIVQRREDLRGELAEANAIVDVARAQIEKTDAQLAGMNEFVSSSVSTTRNKVLDELNVKRIELRLELEAEKNLSGVRSQSVQALNKQIAELDGMMANLPEQVRENSIEMANPVRQTLLQQRSDAELLIASTQQRIKNLQTSITDLEDELRTIGETGLTLTQVYRDIERLRDSQVTYQRALDDAQISSEISAASISNVVVIAKPQGSVAPSKPRSIRSIIIAMVFSIISVSAMILIIDALRPKIRNNNDILPFIDDDTIVRAISYRSA